MEKLYAIRDAFFWWAGVWASVTLCNRAVCTALKRRRHEEREHEYAQWKREFAEFLFGENATPDSAETDEATEPEAAATEQTEAANADETGED